MSYLIKLLQVKAEMLLGSLGCSIAASFSEIPERCEEKLSVSGGDDGLGLDRDGHGVLRVPILSWLYNISSSDKKANKDFPAADLLKTN